MALRLDGAVADVDRIPGTGRWKGRWCKAPIWQRLPRVSDRVRRIQHGVVFDHQRLRQLIVQALAVLIPEQPERIDDVIESEGHEREHVLADEGAE
jgi:hypothetical protein